MKHIPIGVCLMVEQSCFLCTQTQKNGESETSVWKVLWNGGIQLRSCPVLSASEQHHFRIVDFSHVLGWGKVRYWGNISESQTTSRPLPLARRTKKGNDVPGSWARLAAEQSFPPRRVRITRAPPVPCGSWSLTFLLLGGCVLV